MCPKYKSVLIPSYKILFFRKSCEGQCNCSKSSKLNHPCKLQNFFYCLASDFLLRWNVQTKLRICHLFINTSSSNPSFRFCTAQKDLRLKMPNYILKSSLSFAKTSLLRICWRNFFKTLKLFPDLFSPVDRRPKQKARGEREWIFGSREWFIRAGLEI